LLLEAILKLLLLIPIPLVHYLLLWIIHATHIALELLPHISTELLPHVALELLLANIDLRLLSHIALGLNTIRSYLIQFVEQITPVWIL